MKTIEGKSKGRLGSKSIQSKKKDPHFFPSLQGSEPSCTPSEGHKYAEEYFGLLFKVFAGKPVTRQIRKPVSRLTNNGTVYSNNNSCMSALLLEGNSNTSQKSSELRPTADSMFSLRDFTEPIPPYLMEAVAALMCASITQYSGILHCRRLPKPTFIVSAGVRGCGGLTHAVATRLNLSYSLSNWYPDGTTGDLAVERCEGIGGMGWVYLNSVPCHSGVIILFDVLGVGESVKALIKAIQQIEGAHVLGVFTIAEITPLGMKRRREIGGVAHFPLINVEMEGEMTMVSRTTPDPAIPFLTECSPLRLHPTSIRNLLKKMPQEEMYKKLYRVTSSFTGIPIIFNQELKYPYCNFSITDFKPALDPLLIEDIADLAVYFSDFSRCDILVSEGDRGGGPMIQAISVRTHLPYIIATWTLTPVNGVLSKKGHVGFSGTNSQLSLSGIEEGMKCTFVDDMLSSGGTAEAIFGCIRAMGGYTVEAVFASEKLYPEAGKILFVRKGKIRLNQSFPDTIITSLVQFVVQADKTEEPPSRIGE